VPEPVRKSHWKPWLIVLLSGIVLGASSCAGFLSVVAIHSILAVVLAVGFFVGLAATIVGVLGLVLRLILSLIGQRSGDPS
jgi:uncharacterized membrane protein YedE/YeeE